MGAKDYYQILGVGESAGQDEIRKVYRKLAKQYHPDANPDNKQAEGRFKDVSEAYEVLGDSKKRQQYDQMRKFGMGGRGFDFQNFDFRGFGGTGSESNQGGSSFEGFDRFGGLGNIFAQFFDFGERSHQERVDPREGKDIHVEVPIPFTLGVTGGKTTFGLEKESTCPSCDGGGAKPGSKVQSCSHCKGLGRVTIAQGGFAVSRPCPRCFGRGQVITNPCERCHGSGQILGKRSYSVKIPAGIEDGKQIRLKEQGQPGQAGRPSGDIIVKVRIQPHRFFKNRGNDIYCEIPLSLKQAVTGSTIRVKTVTGKKVELKIPSGTQDNTTVRLAGIGIPKNGHCGDQFVTIRVQMPKNPTKEEEELIARLTQMKDN